VSGGEVSLAGGREGGARVEPELHLRGEEKILVSPSKKEGDGGGIQARGPLVTILLKES